VPFAISAQIRKWQTLKNSVCTTVFFIFGKTAIETFRANTHQKTGNHYRTATFRYFCQTKLNTWNRIVSHTMTNCNATSPLIEDQATPKDWPLLLIIPVV
jgi:hypothetical protein